MVIMVLFISRLRVMISVLREICCMVMLVYFMNMKIIVSISGIE